MIAYEKLTLAMPLFALFTTRKHENTGLSAFFTFMVQLACLLGKKVIAKVSLVID